MIQLDYYFPLGNDTLKGLLAVDRTMGYGTSTLVRYEGGTDKYAVRAVTQLLEELDYAEACLQCDDEASIIDLCRAITASTSRTIHVRVSASETPQSNGRVERYHGLVKGITGTLFAALDECCKATVPRRHILLSWAIRHAAFLYNRYQIHESGKTSFQEVYKKPYTSKLVIFGEVIWCKFQKTKGTDPLGDK